MTMISDRSSRRSDMRGLLLLGIALPALVAAPVRAEEQQSQLGAEGEIVVVGSRPIAESESAALEIQKKSDALVSVLAADAIGRLPDQNLAQAISRLPGISVQRDQGQARYVNLRGAPLNWTSLSFDGIFIVSPEGRDARFDSIPSAIASQVIVQKAVTPDMNGETISGNVNIVTRSPFDYKGFHFQSKLGLGYVELGSGMEYEASAVVSNRWETGIGDIGVLLSGSYYKREMVTDNYEIDWEEVPRDLRPLGTGETERRVWAREIENKFYRLTRKNYSVSGRLEWRPDADNKVFLNSVYTIFTDDEFRDNYRLRPDQQRGLVPNSTAACTQADRTPPAGTTGYANACVNTPFQGTVTGSRWDARFRLVDYAQSIFTNTLGGDHQLGNVLLKWRGNYTRSENDQTQPYVITYESAAFGSGATTGVNRPAFSYDFTDYNLSQIQLFRTLRDSAGNLTAGAPATSFREFPNSISQIVSNDAVDITDAYTGRLEAGIDTKFLGDTTFRVGIGYDQRTKTADPKRLTLAGAALTNALTAAGLGAANSLDGLLTTGVPFQGKIDPGYRLDYYDTGIAARILETAQGIGTYVPLRENFYRVREEILSGFVMGTTRFDWGNIVYGARIERVKNEGTAFSNIPGLGQTLVTVNSSNTLVFPSAHINYNVREDMKLRLSFNTGAARPDYSDLRPNFTVNDADERISGGNPFAKPEYAKGVDLYWEWYVMPRGFVSFGVFYKDVKDVLFQDTKLFNSDALNTPGFDRSRYVLSTLVNGGKGEIYGAEAAFQMQLDPFLKTDSFWGGFGIQANVTFNESSAITPSGNKVELPGTSQWVVNVGPYYEKYGFSARVVYQRRTNWFSEIGDPAIGGDIYWATDEELDASARYSITPNFEVYVDASNLLNGPGRRFIGNRSRTLEWERFGRRVQGGIRVTF